MTSSNKDKLYLSRLPLNPVSRQVMREIAHPYEMHRTLFTAFPDLLENNEKGVRDEFGILFRLELDGDQNSVSVLVQSQTEPDWSSLSRYNDYLYIKNNESMPETKEISGPYQDIKKGQLFSFRLRANPTKKVNEDGHPMKGKRVALYKEEEQLEWLRRKADQSGFKLNALPVKNSDGTDGEIYDVRIRNEGVLSGRKSDYTGKHSMTHLSVLFEGNLRVIDSGKFLEALVKGIGSAKAFGFGLLSIAPARRFQKGGAP